MPSTRSTTLRSCSCVAGLRGGNRAARLGSFSFSATVLRLETPLSPADPGPSRFLVLRKKRLGQTWRKRSPKKRLEVLLNGSGMNDLFWTTNDTVKVC